MRNKIFNKLIATGLISGLVFTTVPVVEVMAKNTSKLNSMTMKESHSKIKINQTKYITSTRYNKNWTRDSKYVSFTPITARNIGLTVESNDDNIVSVKRIKNTKYSYTGISAGRTKLTVTSRDVNRYNNRLRATFDITVIGPSVKVKQQSAKSFSIDLGSQISTINKNDVSVYQNGIASAIKDVNLSDDKKSIIVDMYINLQNNQSYTIKYKGKSYNVIASVGEPVSGKILTNSVEASVATEIKYALYDKNGIDVTDTVDKKNITLSVSPTNGYYDSNSNKITLWTTGANANVTLTYYNWKYQYGNPLNKVEARGSITCIPKQAITVKSLDKFLFTNNFNGWNTQSNPVIAKGDHVNLYVRLALSNGTYVDNKQKPQSFTFTSLNNSIAYVSNTGAIYATNEGNSFIKMNYRDGNLNYEATIPFTVGTSSRVVRVDLSQRNVVISNTSTVPTQISLIPRDQYNNVAKNIQYPIVSFMNGQDVANITAKNNSADGTYQLLVSPKGNLGVGQYRISTQGFNVIFSVNSVDVAGASTDYVIQPKVKNIDISGYTSAGKLDSLSNGIALNIYATKGGLAQGSANSDYASPNKIMINGVEIPKTGNSMLKVDSNGQYTFYPVVKDGNDYISFVKTGTYDISILNAQNKIAVGRITVKSDITNPSSSTYSFNSVPAGSYTKQSFMEKVLTNKLGSNNSLSSAGSYARIFVGNSFVGDSFQLKANDGCVVYDALLPAKKLDNGSVLWMYTSNIGSVISIN